MYPANIGNHQIQRELGRGGMGEVYLARDTRLDRLVAIKALPAHLAQEPDRLARLQREAKVLASLNHPNIGAIYGLEEAEERHYLILEFVDGETLAQRLASGPIPVDESLRIARQIAEALEVAHEKGIIHRDLKPGNVMVTPDDAVKVLDFGLARAEDPPSSSMMMGRGVGDSPTVTTPGRLQHSPTIPGVIMGTAGYMSPEQARGKAVDKRSDIFSFGCVLYEMLTGAMPFPGETAADAIGATLHKETDFAALPPNMPRRVRDLLFNCLAKDRKNRLHDIGDARLEIERAMSEPHEALRGPAPTQPWWRSPAVLMTGLLGLAGIVVTSLLTGRPSPGSTDPARVLRAGIPLPTDMVPLRDDPRVGLSPDGTQIVLSLAKEDGTGQPTLYLRDLARLEFRELAGTEGATYPCWSPDGRSVAFFADQKLKRLDLADGIVRVLCDAQVGRGATWGSQGTIVFAPAAGGGLQIVSDAGGAPTPITTVARPGESHRMPRFLPDGRRFLYYMQNSASDGVYAFDPTTQESHLILPGFAEAIYVEPGFLVFARDENLMMQPFDLARLELTGSAKPIAADVHYVKNRTCIAADISPQGPLVYEQERTLVRSTLVWMDRQGVQVPISVEPIAVLDIVRVSSDARRVAVGFRGSRGETSIVLLDLERGIKTPLGDPSAIFKYGALWGPGDQYVISSQVSGGIQSFVSLPLGGGPGTLLMEGESGFEYGSDSITPDGKTLIFTKVPLSTKAGDIMSMPIDQSQPASTFLKTPEPEWDPRISPAGDLIAFFVAGEDAAEGTVKVVTYPNAASPVQVSTLPASYGHWWLSTGELAWCDMSDRLWSTMITVKDGRIEVSAPKPMFDGKPLDKSTRVLDYDRIGDRFLIAIDEGPRENPKLVIVSDWRQGVIDADRTQATNER